MRLSALNVTTLNVNPQQSHFSDTDPKPLSNGREQGVDHTCACKFSRTNTPTTPAAPITLQIGGSGRERQCGAKMGARTGGQCLNHRGWVQPVLASECPVTPILPVGLSGGIRLLPFPLSALLPASAHRLIPDKIRGVTGNRHGSSIHQRRRRKYGKKGTSAVFLFLFRTLTRVHCQ